MRINGWDFRAVDELVLFSWDGTGELLFVFSAHVWFGHGRVHPSRLCRNPAREGGSARRMDGSWLCDWAWCGNTDADTIGWGIDAGPPSEFSEALLMGAGWVINLAVAEWVIRRRQPLQPAQHQLIFPSSKKYDESY